MLLSLREEIKKAKKVAKNSVNYSLGMTKSHCGICVYFYPKDNSCSKIRGDIKSDMWCKLFKKK